VPVFPSPKHIAGNSIEHGPESFNFVLMHTIRHDASLEKVLQVVGQHLNQQKQLITFLVLLTILGKCETILKFVNVVFNVATLVVFIKNFFRRQVVIVSDNSLVFIPKPITIQSKLKSWTKLGKKICSTLLLTAFAITYASSIVGLTLSSSIRYISKTLYPSCFFHICLSQTQFLSCL
jgi:hypothetical protein